MRDSIQQKLRLALKNWQEYLNSTDDFIEIKIAGATGNRTFEGIVLHLRQKADKMESVADKDEQYNEAGAGVCKVTLPGINWTGRASELPDWLATRAASWDSCSLTIVLRGFSQTIEADNKNIRIKAGSILTNKTGSARSILASNHSYGMSDKRDYRVRIDEAANLLEAIGILDTKGKLKTGKWRKYYQIDRFVELAEPVLADLVQTDSNLQVYDLACGKSYLSFVLNYFIREKMAKACTITGIDISREVVDTSRKLAARLDYRNMRFEAMDLHDFKPTGPVSLCISLHACDTATDLALAAAVRAGSKAILVVPCCQAELLNGGFHLLPLDSSLLQSGVLKTRLADLVTDGMRLLLLRSAGYETTILEYISPLETPKNLMIRAVNNGHPDQRAWQEYLRLKELCSADILLGREMEKLHAERWQTLEQS